MNQNEEVRMTQSGALFKDGKRQVFVRFERGKSVAEGSLPACKITRSEGFTPEEVEGLEGYLSAKKEEIFAKARELNDIRKIL